MNGYFSPESADYRPVPTIKMIAKFLRIAN